MFEVIQCSYGLCGTDKGDPARFQLSVSETLKAPNFCGA